MVRKRETPDKHTAVGSYGESCRIWVLPVPGSNVCFVALSDNDSHQSHQCSRMVIAA